MVKIVGEDREAIKRSTCLNCASILEYTLSEVKEYKSYDYTGDCDLIKYIDCPKCSHKVKVKDY